MAHQKHGDGLLRQGRVVRPIRLPDDCCDDLSQGFMLIIYNLFFPFVFPFVPHEVRFMEWGRVEGVNNELTFAYEKLLLIIIN